MGYQCNGFLATIRVSAILAVAGRGLCKFEKDVCIARKNSSTCYAYSHQLGEYVSSKAHITILPQIP